MRVLKDKRKPIVVTIDGQLYDLTEFLPFHPGGAIFLEMSDGKDISVPFKTNHKDLDKVSRTLQKYHVTSSTATTGSSRLPLVSSLSIWKGVKESNPEFNFAQVSQFQKSVIAAIEHDDKLKQRLRTLDGWYSAVTVCLCIVFILLELLFINKLINPWLACFLFIIVRPCLLTAGHTGNHLGNTGWHGALIDVGYNGHSILGPGFHSIEHHSYTDSALDPKWGHLDVLLSLPTLWRVPSFSLKGIVSCLIGRHLQSTIVAYNFFRSHAVVKTCWKYLIAACLIRALMLLEFFLCLNNGLLIPWLVQCVIIMNYFHCLSSAPHEFDPKPQKAHTNIIDPKDWGLYEVQHSVDMYIVGNIWVDSFLSGGLTCHKVHHLLPFQKSPYANVGCDSLVRKMALQRGIVCPPPRSLFLDLLPKRAMMFSTTPMLSHRPQSFLEENFSWNAFAKCVSYVLEGFIS